MKKLTALILTLILILSTVPAAHADGVDALFKALVTERNAEAGREAYSYTRVGDLAIVTFYGSFASWRPLLASGSERMLGLWNGEVEIYLKEAAKLEAYLAEASEAVKLIFTGVDRDDGSLVLVVSQGEVLVDALTGVNLFAGVLPEPVS